MKIDVSLIKSFLTNKKVYPTLIIIFIDILLLMGLVVFGLQIRSNYKEMITLEDDVQEMKATITLIRNNQSIFDGSIEEYNELLEQLIPDQESYFSVISTLEQLSNRTGVFIDSYAVNLGSTTENKLTLKVTLNGDEASIDRFIQEYMYTGGRLLTTESLDITPDDLETLSVSLNFYHNAFKDTVTTESRVTHEDLELLQSIKEEL